jgi:hypothetical protein
VIDEVHNRPGSASAKITQFALYNLARRTSLQDGCTVQCRISPAINNPFEFAFLVSLAVVDSQITVHVVPNSVGSGSCHQVTLFNA